MLKYNDINIKLTEALSNKHDRKYGRSKFLPKTTP
jgi:hypothetical protein